MTREAAIAALFVFCVMTGWSSVSRGRPFCILSGLLILGHVSVRLCHHCMAGFDQRYLRDGLTQDDLLNQLHFKVAVGYALFVATHVLLLACLARRGGIVVDCWARTSGGHSGC